MSKNDQNTDWLDHLAEFLVRSGVTETQMERLSKAVREKLPPSLPEQVTALPDARPDFTKLGWECTYTMLWFMRDRARRQLEFPRPYGVRKLRELLGCGYRKLELALAEACSMGWIAVQRPGNQWDITASGLAELVRVEGLE